MNHFLTVGVLALAAANPAGDLPLPKPMPVGENAPNVRLVVQHRDGNASTSRTGMALITGGAMDVSQPAPATVVIDLMGSAFAAYHLCKSSEAELTFDVCQHLKVEATKPQAKPVLLVLDSTLRGVLHTNKTHKPGAEAAELLPVSVVVEANGVSIAEVAYPPRVQSGVGEHLTINDHRGPVQAVVVPGTELGVRIKFAVRATHPYQRLHHGTASAEFRANSAETAMPKDPGLHVTIRLAALPEDR